MGRDVAGGGEVKLGGGLEEREQIVELEKEDDNPVDACDDTVLSKGGCVVLTPDSLAVFDLGAAVLVVVMLGFGWSVESVPDGGEEE